MGPPKQAFRPPKPVQRATSSSQTQSQNQSQRQGIASSSQIGGGKQDQQIVSKEDSLNVMKVALEASIGYISYLRNILPKDDFDICYIAPSHPPTNKNPNELYHLTRDEAVAHLAKKSSSQPQSNTQSTQSQAGEEDGSKLEPHMFNWRKIKKDGTSQARNLSELLERGAMDALKKGYLHSLMLLILLNEDEPTNVIETYTFNFFYHKQTGAPSLEVAHNVTGKEDQLDSSERNEILGSAMTHLEVRRLLKDVAKSLVQECQALEDLPQKRFVDIKLFYNEKTPENYIAPGFADTSGERMIFGTKDINDPPIMLSFPNLQTGHHGQVSHISNQILSTTALSVIGYLPEGPKPDAEGPEDYASRFVHDDVLLEDAEERDIIWDANIPAFDRLSYDPSAQDVYTATIDSTKAVPYDSAGALKQPIGRKQMDGTVKAITLSQKGKGTERSFRGRSCKGSRFIAEETLQMSQTLNDHTPIRTSSSLSSAEHGRSLGGDALFIPPSQSLVGNNSQAYLERIEETNEDVEDGPGPSGSGQHSSTNNNDNTPPLSSQVLAAALRKKVMNNKRGAVASDDIEPPPPSRKPRTIKSIVSQAMKNGGYEPTLEKSKITPKPKSKAKTKPKPKPKTKPNTDALTQGRKPKTRSNQTKVQEAVKKINRKPIGKKSLKKSQSQDLVDCFCGSNDEDDSMIQCDGCNKWLHATCLGFMESQSASQLQVFCLICQMRNDRSKKWRERDIELATQEMCNLALVRRVIQYLQRQRRLLTNEVPKVQTMFTCTFKEVKTVLQKLQDQGLIQAVDGDDSTGAGWQWLKTPAAVKKYTAYFQYGRGIENEIFEFRKAYGSTQSQPSQSQPSQSQPSQSLNPSQTANPSFRYTGNSQASRVPDSQEDDSDKDAEGEDDPAHPQDASNSQREFTPYQLPKIRSSRARKILNCTDNWTNRDDDLE